MATDLLRSAFELLSKPLSAESEQRIDFAINQYDAIAREATYQYYPGSGSDSAESEESVSVRDKAVTPPMVGLGPPPMPENATSDLQQMLTSWYYAGYYAGLYAGKNIRNS
jgi:Survival motor neuron protein (SMN)